MTVRLLGLLLATVSTPAIAQHDARAGTVTSSGSDPTAADQTTDAPSEEIIVTARRREESLSDVPIAITAIGGQQLAQRSIQTENDLQSAVPGLTIRQNGNANSFNYAIRGQSVDTFTNSPPGVLPYTDDVQIATRSASAFYDLEGLQVLKGPQGTLFGRNATGGAVLYETGRVRNEFGGYLSGRYGNYDAFHVEGAINVPLSEAVGFRIAGSITGGGAYVYNIPTNRNIGNLEQRSIRGTLRLRPFHNLTNTTVVQYTHDGGTNTPNEAYSVYAPGSTSNGIPLNTTAASFYDPASPAFAAYSAAHANIYQGGVTAFTALQNARGPFVSAVDYPDYHRAESEFLINTTVFEVMPGLTVKNIVGYNDMSSTDGQDYDGTPYPIFHSGGVPSADATTFLDVPGFRSGARQFSEELQAQGTAIGSRLNYVVGVYYLNERDTFVSNLYAFGFSPIAPGQVFAYAFRTRDQSIAGFAQATYRATDRLSLTGGFRYTHDDLSARQQPGSVFIPFFGTASQHRTNEEPSWTASVDYRLTPSLLAYVATRGSWRAGGFNYSVAPVDTTGDAGGNVFLPETTKDVEAGLKYSGDSLGVPITFNVDLYNQWVNNIQRAAYFVGVGGSPTLVTVNVPRAQITGVEGDFTIRPTSWLQLGLSGAYTNARYTNGNLVVVGSPVRFGPYADAPKLTGNLFAEVSHELEGHAGTLRLRGDAYAQSRLNFSNVGATTAPFSVIPSYALVNGRLTWSDLLGTRITAAVFVRNLLDKHYYAGGNAIGPALGLNVVNPGQPRLFGGELRIDF